MVGETKMNRNASQDGTETSPGVDVGRLLHRLLELMELQVELLNVDTREGFRSLVPPAILIGGGLVAAFGAIFVLLLTVAALLNEWAGWSATLALFTASVLGLLFAAGSALLGWKLTCKALSKFDRSKTEFQKNFAWLKTTLANPYHDRSKRQRIQ